MAQSMDTAVMAAIRALLSSAALMVMSLRKRPCRMTMKWRKGLSSLKCCKNSGMLLTGVMKPESRMHGTATVKQPRKACCCVEANDDTISPMLLTENENRSMVP